MTEALKLAVVGHTNVGKTSLLRTLTRDIGFGEVSHRPSTTRHVEGARLSVDGEPLLELDTPAWKMQSPCSTTSNGWSAPVSASTARHAPRAFSTAARHASASSRKPVLRQCWPATGLYVIDAREPVLAKYKDELAVLAGCGKPLLPVLNFVAQPGHRDEEWRQALARLGLHALVRFDSVAPPVDGERRLYESLALLLEQARPDRGPRGPGCRTPGQRPATDRRTAGGCRRLPTQRGRTAGTGARRHS